MRWLLAMAVLLAGLGLPSSLDAQRPGAAPSWVPNAAQRGSTFGPIRSAPNPIRPFAPRPAPAPTAPRHGRFDGGPHHYQLDAGYWPGTPCLTNPGYAGSFFCRQNLPHHSVSFLPVFVSFFAYLPEAYPAAEVSPAPAPEPETALASQVEHLAEEVELLREDRTSSASAAAPSPAAPPEELLPAVLVYRDGHQREVVNYAVMGQTLYVFAGQTTRRISLALLDLEATRKVNEERGVDFVPPATP